MRSAKRRAAPLDYTEQTSWLLFLKYFDGLEQDRAEIDEMEIRYILQKLLRHQVFSGQLAMLDLEFQASNGVE
jgi:hypothetical protein